MISGKPISSSQLDPKPNPYWIVIDLDVVQLRRRSDASGRVSSVQISNRFSNRDKRRMPVSVTAATSSIRTPPRPGIIQARLNRQHLPRFEHGFLKPRELVNLQSKPVAGAVEKPDLPPVAHFGREIRDR